MQKGREVVMFDKFSRRNESDLRFLFFTIVEAVWLMWVALIILSACILSVVGAAWIFQFLTGVNL